MYQISCISIMTYELENITILNLKGIGHRYVTWNMTRNDAISRVNNFKLDYKGSSSIWPLVQIKHQQK